MIEIHDDDTEKKRKRGSPQKIGQMKKKTKLVACGECEGCLTKACKKCDACKRKKRCSLRKCSDVRRIPIADVREKSNGKKDNNDEESGGEEGSKPRIRISLGKKRKSRDDDDNDEEIDSSQNSSSRKKARRSPAPSDDEEDDYNEMFDIELLDSKQKDLKGASFLDARENLTMHGPWRLPKALASNPAGFKEVAKITLSNIAL